MEDESTTKRRSRRESKGETKEESRREREREKVHERKDRKADKERTSDRETRRSDRDRDRDRESRHREREKEKSRERKRDRTREKVREERDGVDHDRKRRRREDSPRERDRERERSNRSERQSREVSEERRSRKKAEEETKVEEVVDPEEEQRKLDEEMDKRRRRVQEWQELRRKKDASEKSGGADGEEEPVDSGKKWTLEGESDDEESVPPIDDEEKKDDEKDGGSKDMDVEDLKPLGNGDIASSAKNEDEEEIDPLDAFMNALEFPPYVAMTKMGAEGVSGNLDTENHKPGSKISKQFKNGDTSKRGRKIMLGRIIPGEDSDSDYGSDLEEDEVIPEDENDDEFMKRVKKTKVEKLTLVDHSKIQYPPFRKNFYIESKEIARMSAEEAVDYRRQLELKLHGKDVPKPVKTWNQTGLTSKILDTIKKLNFERPMSIQAQALPIIMSGRDCIGVAKTGSGKTLAFVLPMLRHIKDQPPVVAGDGPIGLIMAPTRELVQQIHSDIKKFSKVMGLTCVPVYGGSGVAQQISDLKRGAEIVVCTPGRMIDILCTSSGKITNLRRVTYLVMDEADRMFDMGFEPQITRMVQNTRPDRQTVLFSATFPRQVEILARKVLTKPVEIQVGGRSVVNKDITQLVEVRQESERFFRLLELLGEWYEKGKILVFVHSQDKCDSLFKDLLRHGYPCLSLHGAKDQTDRESTVSDFKSNVCNLMIATSIAARGLDVKDLELVVNFDVPNHYEDYVHRVGRTGRAGRKGCAITFISEDDARYAPDLVKALELSEQAVPEDLKSLADGFMAKVNLGTERAHGTGYGGSGFKFNEEEDEARKSAKKAQAREYGFEEDKSDSESEDEGVRKAGGDLSQAAAIAQAQAALLAAVSRATTTPVTPTIPSQLHANVGLQQASLPVVVGLTNISPVANPGEAAARAAALAAAMNLQHNLARIQADALPEHYEAELEINEFPQNARWKVTHKETIIPISEFTGAAITTRGQYYPPGRIPAQGERKLYLFIEGSSESSVKKAKNMLKHVLEEFTSQSLNLPGAAQPGKYSVL